MRRWTLLILVLLLLPGLAWGANTHGTPSEALERQSWFGDALAGYAVSGCLPTTSGTTTTGTFACNAYVKTSGGELVYVTQPTKTVGPLPSTNGTYWIAVHRDISTAVGGWTRQSGTHYLWKTAASATQVADPANGMVIAGATVSGCPGSCVISARVDVRLPRSYVKSGVFDMTDPLYGGSPNASAATNTTALQTIMSHNSDNGIVVAFTAPGTYLFSANVWVTRNNVTLRGSPGVTLKADTGFVNTSNKGLLTFGWSPTAGTVGISHLQVRDLVIDANSLVTPIQVHTGTNIVIARNRLYRSDTLILAVYTGTNVTIEGNYLEGGAGAFGDGIYGDNITGGKYLHNTIYDFTRIGITSEGGAGTESRDILIDGNTISYAHDSTGGQLNAGIWCENTVSCRVVNNYISNIWNNPAPGTASRGITFGNVAVSNGQFVATNNTVSGAEIGIALSNEFSYVLIDGLRVEKGAKSSYISGVHILGGRSVRIRNLDCGTNAYPVSASGCVLVDAQGSIDELTIADSHVSDVGTGGMTYSAAAGIADLNVFSAAGGIGRISLRNVQGPWDLSMRGAATQVTISDSTISHDASTYAATQVRERLLISNSYVIGRTASSPFWWGAQNNSEQYLFTNVVFNDVDATFNNGAATNQAVVMYNNCIFRNQSAVRLQGTYKAFISDSYFNEYKATDGAVIILLAGLYNTDLHLSNVEFVHTVATNYPIRLPSNNANNITMTNVRFNTSIISTPTLRSTLTVPINSLALSQGVFADLGTPLNGALMYCADCTVASPCAGGGTGALAKRLNGAWVCN